MRFRDKVALISGAGSGIGRATAQMIGGEGGTVVGVDLDQIGVAQIIDGIRRAGGKAHAIVTNALDAAQVAQVVQQDIEACGHLDILVNAVGAVPSSLMLALRSMSSCWTSGSVSSSLTSTAPFFFATRLYQS